MTIDRATAGQPADCDQERGFTLVDLMVVILIIGVLLAIAIPAFLGAKTRAQAKAAQSSLGHAATSAKVVYTDAASYLTATPTALTKAEPGLRFVATGTASTGPRQVSVNSVSPAAGGTAIFMTALTASRVCYVIGTWSTGGTFFARLATGATCSATQATTTLKTVLPKPAATSKTSATTGAWVIAW